MDWFRRKETPPESPGPALAVQHQSLAFKAALRDLEREGVEQRRPLLLDLGPVLGSNVEFFTERSCRVQIADLFRSLPADAAAEPERLAQDLTAALPTPEQGATLVLAWDLFNYFRLEALTALGERLASCTAPGGIVFALLATHKTMPPQPQRYRIVDDSTLETAGGEPAAAVPAPRYRQPELERALPAFRVETTYLLRAGMQEYLLRRREAS